MVSIAVAIFMFFQINSLISYSLFLSRDAGEDEASASALNLEAGTLAAAVRSYWARTGSIRRGGWAASEVRGLMRREDHCLCSLVRGRVK